MTTSSPWRVRPIDGALFGFHPSTGTCVRWDGPATRNLVQTAPRVVLFGITNACNLRCGFCSRDAAAASEWDAESAFRVLRDLCRAGVLEVAFGGGEPFAFRGFDDLLERLFHETALAIHVTTNGTLLDRARAERIRPFLGEVRLSMYDDEQWAPAAAILGEADVRYGVNVVVTPSNLGELAGRLDRLEALGCRDVAFLRYVGPDLRLHLAPADEARLTSIVERCSMRTRLSVCFGDRLEDVPRLFGGDCGAGRDFVTLTSDRRIRGCSFQDDAAEVRTAQDVLDAWRRERRRLAAAAERFGCARPAPPVANEDGLRVWRSYAGNNSGDCVLVGRFDAVDDADAFVAELLPLIEGGLEDSARAFLASERIVVDAYEQAPEVLVAIGRSVLAHTDQAADDDFPWLRALLDRRGGRAVFDGIHVHDPLLLVGGVRVTDDAARDALAAEFADASSIERRGDDLFALWPLEDLGASVERLEGAAAANDGKASAEIIPADPTTTLVRALSRRPAESPTWLWAQLPDEATAARVGKPLKDNAMAAGRYVVAQLDRPDPRFIAAVYRAGGYVTHLFGPKIGLVFVVGQNNADLEPRAVRSALRSYTSPGDVIEAAPSTRPSFVEVTVTTARPHVALRGLHDYASGRQLTVWCEARPVTPLASAIQRIARDLDVRR